MIILNAPVEVLDEMARPMFVCRGIDWRRLFSALDHAGFDVALRVDGKVLIQPGQGRRAHALSEER